MIPYSGTNFSSEDMLKMQQEAIQRVREMQKIARERIERTNSGAQNENSVLHIDNSPNMQNISTPIQNQNNAMPNRIPSGNNSNLGISNTIENLAGIPKKALSSISNALESVGIDNDRLLIIIMILILLSDDSDKSLVLALFYLLF